MDTRQRRTLAGIEHIKAIGEYTHAWDASDKNAILTAWEEVQRTRAICLKLDQELAEEGE